MSKYGYFTGLFIYSKVTTDTSHCTVVRVIHRHTYAANSCLFFSVCDIPESHFR